MEYLFGWLIKPWNNQAVSRFDWIMMIIEIYFVLCLLYCLFKDKRG